MIFNIKNNYPLLLAMAPDYSLHCYLKKLALIIILNLKSIYELNSFWHINLFYHHYDQQINLIDQIYFYLLKSIFELLVYPSH